MDFETAQAHMVIQTEFGPDQHITFVLATVDNDGTEACVIVMEVNDAQTVLCTFDPNVTLEVAASATWAMCHGSILSASDRAHDAIIGPDDSNESAIIIPNTADVVAINKEKN